MKHRRRSAEDIVELNRWVRDEAQSPIGCSCAPPIVPPPRPTKKKPTTGEIEQQAQRDRDRAAGRLVDLGAGGYHRQRARPAP